MNIDKCECGRAPKITFSDGVINPKIEYSVYCPGCALVGPWRSRRCRAVESWNSGRRLPQIGDDDPFAPKYDHLVPKDEQDDTGEDAVKREILANLLLDGIWELKEYKDARTPPTGWLMLNENVSLGNTPGQPDLWVRCHNWPLGLWLAIEIKGRVVHAALEPNQLILDATKGICVCWTYQMVQKAIQCVNKNM